MKICKSSSLLNILVASSAFAISVVVVRSASAQVTFTDDFNRTTLGPNYTVSASTGFSESLDGSSLILTKATGTTTSGISIITNFLVVGDFTATVSVARQSVSGSGSTGIGAVTPSVSLADTYFFGSGQINGNIFQPTFTQDVVNTSSLSSVFEISRVGNTVIDYYNTGSGLVALNSKTDPSLGGPTNISLILDEEQGQSIARLSTLDNLTITAQGFLGSAAPEPSAFCLLVAGSIGFGSFLARKRMKASLFNNSN